MTSSAEPGFSTCDLCDEFPDEVRVVQMSLRDFGGRTVFGGPAVTVRCADAEGPDNTLVKELAGTPGEGRVLVVDADARWSNAVLGDVIAADAVAHGWAGMVILGVVRDVEILRTLDLGVKALGSVPMKSNRRGVGDRDVTVDLNGVLVAPGDHVYADETGVVVAGRALV